MRTAGRSSQADLIAAEKRLLAATLRGDALKRRNGSFPEIEHALIRALAPLIPETQAVDVGAYKGAYAELFLSLGFDAAVCEPVPSLMQGLRRRYRDDPRVRLIHAAIGAADGQAEFRLARLGDAAPEGTDPDLFNTLAEHPTADILTFAAGYRTPVRSLRSLVAQGLIDPAIGILKIDTEGCDRDVLRGAAPHLGRVTLCEFWNRTYVFAGSGTPNDVADYRAALQDLGPYRILVLGRDDAQQRMFFQVDPTATVPASWGRLLITADETVLAAAIDWCMAVFGRSGIEV